MTALLSVLIGAPAPLQAQYPHPTLVGNAKERIPEPDAATQAIFDQGHEVGELAKALYPGGIEVSADVTDFEQVLQKSLEATKARKPVFEAGFTYNGGFARADILKPLGRNEWDIIEVKSSTEVKGVNLLDLAFQVFVYNGAGLNIRRRWLMHVDRSYLDFETFGTAILLFDGISPYQQVPFQFSLHRQPAPGAKPEHHAFLADGRGDPRPEFLNRLRDCIGDKGTVVVYNAKFETGMLDGLAEAFPKHTNWIAGVEARIIDLLEPFEAFDYYHPEQHGSASIKAVLPVLTGHSHTDLEIQEGGQANLEYLRVHFDDVPEDERRKVRQQLERYCGQDTEGMVWIVDALRMLAG